MTMSVPIACQKLAEAGLVIGSQGNASERYQNMMLIKPSGVACAAVSTVSQVALKQGKMFGWKGPKPSTDARAHLWIYNHIPEINGVVHTHSPYATAWAIAGWAIPCCTTAQSDVFGGDIPCGAYCPIGETDIGEEIVRLYQHDFRRRAFLIRQHGLFTIGRTLDEAVDAAIMAEHFAQVTWLAQRMTGLKLIPKDEMNANYTRYHTTYGQPADHSEPDREPQGAGDR